MKIKRSGFLWDTFLNMLASFMLIGFVQLFIFPFFSARFSGEEFGIIVMFYGLSNLIVNSTGNSLNNSYLLKKIKLNDIDSLLYWKMILQSLVFSAVLVLILKTGFMIGITFIFLTVLSSIRIYSTVIFRVELNYSGILVSNIVLVIGYIFGLMVFKVIHVWPLVFVFGEIFTLFYIQNKTKFLPTIHKFNRNKLFSYKEYIDYYFLILSNLVSNSIVYLDRLLVIPLVGSYSLSVFYASSTIPKMLSLVITPIVTVLLSYLSRYEKSLKRIFSISILVTIAGSFVSYFIILFISPTIINILYPSLLTPALEILPIVIIGNLLSVSAAFLNTFLMKICSFSFQFYLNTAVLFLYIVLALFLTNKFELVGFCYATIIINVFKLLSIIIAGKIKLKEENCNEN